ncbi:MAG: beta-galactosidase [Minisyncoccales bacterium]
MIKRIFQRFFLILAILVLLFLFYFFLGSAKPAEEIVWGVNFSQKHAANLGLDWQETYWAILDDLKARHLKIAVAWDLIEPRKDQYEFADLDWQIQAAQQKEAKVLLVIGMKTPRWPECHLPGWAKNSSKEEQQKEILEMLEKIVLRYRDSSAIWAWQVENEIFFPFGLCPWTDKDFFKKEIALVKKLDPFHPVVVTDSGEFSFWWRVAGLGDIVGVTMYRQAWFKELNTSVRYPFPSVYYYRKAKLVEKILGKKVICVELQAEPWGKVLLYDLPLNEQLSLMDLEKFKNYLEYAKSSGLDTFYLWGAEWWYWLKEEKSQPEFWQEAKTLFL